MSFASLPSGEQMRVSAACLLGIVRGKEPVREEQIALRIIAEAMGRDRSWPACSRDSCTSDLKAPARHSRCIVRCIEANIAIYDSAVSLELRRAKRVLARGLLRRGESTMKHIAKIFLAGAISATAFTFALDTASAAVVCNGVGDCWHTHESYDYPEAAGIIVHPDGWAWQDSDHDRYRWREHEGRGYWHGDSWTDF
jgi:hypothetical protein